MRTVLNILLILMTCASVAKSDALKGRCTFFLYAINSNSFPIVDPITARALTNLTLVKMMLSEGRLNEIKTKYYDGALPTQTILKQDLEFISHKWHWADDNFRHTPHEDYMISKQAMQFALAEGAELAEKLNDPEAAKWYRKQSDAILFHLRFLEFLRIR